eukprot:CAMPEP_0174930972 /NCGR_PEP_ID=MMETSP1355-20121228/31729_1 /TAXON_ID=464990 /ORGANISM="Hemiselmis tepida, Strain CCMP443" /LENGTH=461 /DNA_ID=CAMNT_0016177293 /DNA_START=89 /DNA_END=1470 /DNA_ORIENTATION=+
MATADKMQAMMKETGLDKYLKETVLGLIEKQPIVSPDTLEAIAVPAPVTTPEEDAERIASLKQRIQLMKKDVPPAADAPPPEEGAEPEYILPVEVEGDLGDVLADFKLLERAGVGFGKPASVRMHLALKMLMHRNQGAQEGEKIVRARSWGKVLGLERDYMIAEVVMEGRQPMPPLPEGEQPPSVVPRDAVGDSFADFVTSSNQFVYYVCNTPGEDWTRLPDVQPEHIRAARLVQRAFTGVLSANVSSKAPFPGKELEYLRAQIARIAHDTRIAPRGHLVDATDYEGGGDLAVGQSEEGTFHGLTPLEMCDLRNKAWVHAAHDLLPQGRASYYGYGWAPPDDKPDAKDPRLEKNRPPLQSIHLDPAPHLGAPAWSAHVCGGLAPEYACTVVRSNLWPGACTVGQGYTFVNYYVGNGCQTTGTMFAPAMAWAVAKDVDHPEYARGPKANGICGDLNLEPPPP